MAARRAPTLVGRKPALLALRAALDAAAGGYGQLVLVAGEAGIGKTSLAAAIASEAEAAGALVLWGQCWEHDGAPAAWPWVQVLRDGVAAGGNPGEASRLLPGAAAPEAEEPADARFRMLDAVAHQLRSLARQRPVLVVLEDLHWADDLSLTIAEFCARHLQAAPVLLVGTYREAEASPALLSLTAAARMVPLGGLATDEVAALVEGLVGTALSADAARRVRRRTGGNPLFVGELARLLAGHPDGASALWDGSLVPESVREVLLRRLARLSQPCVDLLGMAAVAGPDVRTEVLQRAEGAPADALTLLDEAVAAGVLVPGEQSGVRFSHDLFRETILTGLPAGTRAGLHLAVGRALEQLRTAGTAIHPAELAVHFHHAGAAAAPQALHYSMLAAEDAAARLAFGDACVHLERALACLEHPPEPAGGSRLELLLRLADARNRAGDVLGAREACRAALDLGRALPDPVALARGAIVLHGLGSRVSHAESIAALEEALAALPDRPDPLRARVCASLARDLHHSAQEQDWERAPAIAERAVRDSRALGDASTLGFCLLALHDATWRPGTAAVRIGIADEIAAASDAAGDRELAAQSRLLKATALLELGDPAGVRELEAYCRQAEALASARARHGARSRRATLALLHGDLQTAVRLADEALELGQTIGEPDALGVHETLLWGVCRVGGTWRRFSLDSDPWPQFPLADAVLALHEGDVDAARRALAGLRIEHLPRTHDLELSAFAAETVAVAGTASEMQALLAVLAPFAGTHVVVGGCASYFGAVDYYLGLLAEGLGRTADARSHFDDATALHHRIGAHAFAALTSARAARIADAPQEAPDATFRREGAVWTVSYLDVEAHVPDRKGMRDLAVLLAAPHQAVSALELHTGNRKAPGADPVIDDAAKAAYRRRLAELDAEIDDAEHAADPYRRERAELERDALLGELAAAVGLGGRDRRLGDDRERARKAVSARIRDALDELERLSPPLARHLVASVQTGAWCVYAPDEPVRWQL